MGASHAFSFDCPGLLPPSTGAELVASWPEPSDKIVGDCHVLSCVIVVAALRLSPDGFRRSKDNVRSSSTQEKISRSAKNTCEYHTA